MTIEIVDFPIKKNGGSFPVMLVYQRVSPMFGGKMFETTNQRLLTIINHH